MAGRGVNFGQDFSMEATANAKTSTSQFGFMVANTSAAFFAGPPATEAEMKYSYGVCQTRMTAGSKFMTIRPLGMSAVKCAASVTAGRYVKIVGTNTGYIGDITEAVTVQTSVVEVVGRAMRSGSTNSVVEIMVNPYLAGPIS